MSFVKIKYLGGIEGNDKNSPDFTSLTGSSTYVDINGFKGIIDYGIFQGGKNDTEKNSEVLENPDKIDFIVLTHAHADHCGRLPMLIKNGYSGPIYTTKLTGEQTKEMLLDNVRIMRAEIEKVKNFNEKYFKQKNGFEFLVKAYEALSSSSLSTEERKKLRSQIYKKFGDLNEKEFEKKYEEAKKYLEENKDSKSKEKPELLFDETDVENTVSMFKFVDNGDEIVIKENFSFSSPNLTLNNLLSAGYQKSSEKVYLPIENFEKINLELEERIENTKKILEKNSQIDEKNKIIRQKIEKALEVIGNFDEIINIGNVEIPEVYKESKKFLEEIGVSDFHDIDDVLEKKFKIIYTLDDLYSLKKNLKISLEKEYLEKLFLKEIRLRFFKAGHIEGSSQVMLSLISEVLQNFQDVFEEQGIPGFERKNEKFTNLLFSGDLGRIKDPNLPGIPEKIPYKLDYLQLETTYAGRVHPDRIEVEKRFFDEIENFYGKILIPAFSIQRTQEILFTILSEMRNKISDKKELAEQKENLKRYEEILNKTEDKDSIQAKRILRAINVTKKIISELKKSIIFQKIIVDSPLSTKITDIYKNDEKIGKKYDLLRPEVQREIFGEEVVHFVNGKEEQELIHSGNRKDKKEIIISSSGMCDGGSVLYHLQNMLGNKNAKIIFVGYCPETTIGGKIKSNNSVMIDGKNINIDCKIADLSGFSAHADEEEILYYLKNLDFKKGAQIALTHGSSNRYDFVENVQKSINGITNKIKILVPDLQDEVSVKI